MHRTLLGFLLGALVAALITIVRLRRELATARSRGDMYRDIAAGLDRQHAQPATEFR